MESSSESSLSSNQFETGTKMGSCGERRRGVVANCYCCARERDAAVVVGTGITGKIV